MPQSDKKYSQAFLAFLVTFLIPLFTDFCHFLVLQISGSEQSISHYERCCFIILTEISQ
jgi:hypothetical protein